MMHTVWSRIHVEEVPYCFSISSVTFRGRTGQKITNFDLNSGFPDCNSSVNSRMALKWHPKLEELENISTWAIVNRLSLNIGKTQFMIFTRKKCQRWRYWIIFWRYWDRESSFVQFFGIIIHENLSIGRSCSRNFKYNLQRNRNFDSSKEIL